MNAQPALARRLTLPLLTLYGLGVTVGAGIYVLLGATAAEAGLFAPVSFLAAAVVVAFTAFSYAELGTRHPVSAGEAAYVEAGFGSPRLSVVIGGFVALSGIVSAAAVSIGAAAYLALLLGLPAWMLTAALVVAMGAIAAWGIGQSVMVAGAITVIEIGGLLLVIGWSASLPAVVPLADLVPPLAGPHWLGIGAASLLAFFAFVGFEDIANVAEEVRDPLHTLPRAIVLTLVVATVLYLGVAVAVLRVVPLAELTGSDAPLSTVFAAAPAVLRDGFFVLAIVATVNGILIQTIMASRVIYGLADRGHLPAALARVSPRTRTPVVATALVTATILALALSRPIGDLAEWTSQIVLGVFVVVNVALIRLKRRAPPPAPHFHVPLIVPVLGALSSAALLASGFL